MGTSMRVVVATTNDHKVTEIAAILQPLVPGIELLAMPAGSPEVDEVDTTLEGNASLKAQAIGRWTNMATIADDSGLFVDALDGAPGVRSARFAEPLTGDAANRVELARRLAELPQPTSGLWAASFRCAVALYVPHRPSGVLQFTVTGMVPGQISTRERGDGGFGYDPMFIPDEADGRTFAQMPSEEKNQISHRRRALETMARIIAKEIPTVSRTK